ncbi:DEAD-box ATP-dependent RNA helicase 42 [Pseudomonas amygdali pv. mori]|uniref:DEAD-box ATP-dependent RNA helicase 42 n=1 Tax=Pseudomonas amygdali pv. mori TaxID=34065 RepID=A0A3M5JRA5_PSEA0|nr:DEAD-box ATP-dependent RNA helicase 42 [Pseudomonas amygdali pv. mori]
MKRQLVAEIHPPNFSHHFHANHLVFSCSESEQKQLNSWVSFRSAATLLHQRSQAIEISRYRDIEISRYHGLPAISRA